MNLSQMIPVSQIVADSNFNCRGKIDPTTVQDLANDINDHGLMQAVTVAPMDDGRYKLVAGFRRFMAINILGWTEIEAKVNPELKDEKLAAVLNIVENVQRSELNIVQEALALGRLFRYGMTEQEVMDKTNMTRGWVQLRKMVWLLPPDSHPDIANGTITQTNIRELYTLYTTQPVEQFWKEFRWIKEERAKGKRGVSLNERLKTEVARNGPKIRNREELREMQALVQSTTGEIDHIIAKTIGWAAGNVAGTTYMDELDRYFKDNGYKDDAN